MRAKHLKKPAAFPLEGLPQVKLAYRLWRAPALDFIVSAGVTYDAGSGARVDRRASIRAAGEIARMSYDATVTSADRGVVPNVRFKAYRSEPDGGLLGPLDATHFAVGDVAGPTNRLIAGGSGRGAEVTNRPLFNPASFDRTRFDGDLPAGWDAELYRNGQLSPSPRARGAALRFRGRRAWLWRQPLRDHHLRPAGAAALAGRDDQRRAGACSARQDLLLCGDQPAGQRPARLCRSPARGRPRVRRRSRRGAQAPGGGGARAWDRQAHLGRRRLPR